MAGAGDLSQAGIAAIRAAAARLDKLLECPVCLEEMKPPRKIFQCSNGHAICEYCRHHREVTCCPTCRIVFTKESVTRNILAESLAEATNWEEDITDTTSDDLALTLRPPSGRKVCRAVAGRTQSLLARSGSNPPSGSSSPAPSVRQSTVELLREARGGGGRREVVQLTSSGPASEWLGGRLGLYVRTGTHNQRPCYQQLDTLGETAGDQHQQLHLYTNTAGEWLVSGQLGKERGALKNCTKSARVPHTRWQFWSGRGWPVDPALVATHLGEVESLGEVLSCAAVTISTPTKSGEDTVQEFVASGEWCQGRPVYRSADTGLVLLVPRAQHCWMVRASATRPAPPSLRSGSAPDICPAHPRAGHSRRHDMRAWQFYSSEEGWLDTPSVVVKCATHTF